MKGELAKLEQEKNALKADKERYKTECNKLKHDLAGHIQALKGKLENAEKKLEEKCGKAKNYADAITEVVNVLGESYDEESESGKNIIKVKGLLLKLQKSLGSGGITGKLTLKDASVQAADEGTLAKTKHNIQSNINIDSDKQITEMRYAVESMKKHMKDLECIYEGELNKLAEEKEKSEREAKSKIQDLEAELQISKKEMARLKEKASQLVDCITEKKEKTSNNDKSSVLEDSAGKDKEDNKGGWNSVETFYEKPNTNKAKPINDAINEYFNEDEAIAKFSPEINLESNRGTSSSKSKPSSSSKKGEKSSDAEEHESKPVPKKSRHNALKEEIEGLDKDIEELQKGFFKSHNK